MSRLTVVTDAPAGGDRIDLGTIGNIQGLRYSSAIVGDLDASWQMQLDPKTDHRALAPGRQVFIPYGANKGWRGYLNNPKRGDVWQLDAIGKQAWAQNYVAVAATTGNAYKLDEIVDAAIARGWPVTRPSALPTLTAGAINPGVSTVADALNYVQTAKNVYWTLNRDGTLTAAALPTTVAYLLQSSDTAGGRQLTGFVTDAIVTYLDASTYQTTTITRSAASKPFGTVEVPLDLTGLGPITAAQAQTHGDNYVARNGARLHFTGSFTIRYGDLLSLGGTPVDLACVQATDGLVRIMLTDPDSAAGELALGTVQAMPGKFEYDVDADLAYLTPLDRTPTGLSAVLS